ncbi:hypothetical protein ACTXJX_17275 [Glutamicibacter ardleyensis]|uniref:hypothetical protein n=1 Tax=Glutamicibacter ardleyensis TaxID=225894 RepID=UPI003FD50A70
MLNTISTAVTAVAAKTNALTVTADGYNPNIGVNDDVPGAAFASDMAGGVFFYAYIGLGVALVLAGLLWGIGKLSKNQGMQSVGVGAVVTVLIAAVLVGSANGLIAWFSSQSLT